MSNQRWLIAILIAPFVKGCAFPGWSSAVELAFCCGLVAFLTYFRPKTEQEIVQSKEVDELRQSVAALSANLNALKMKIGFRTQQTG